jgi:hypothetical protein
MALLDGKKPRWGVWNDTVWTNMSVIISEKFLLVRNDDPDNVGSKRARHFDGELHILMVVTFVYLLEYLHEHSVDVQ